MNYICTRCERRYRERIARCLTCGGHIRSIQPPIRPALALFFAGLSCSVTPTSITIARCEKLVGVTFRERELYYLTRSMRPREVPESYTLYEHSEMNDFASVRLTERCP